MDFGRRMDFCVQLYFNCPEKMEQISRMCEETNNEDMMLIVSTGSGNNKIASHIIKFGQGWMGKDAEIRLVDYGHREGVRGIFVLVTI